MKILLALDGSAPSMVARDLVAGLPWPEGTLVQLLAAYQVPADWTAGVGSSMDWIGDVEDAERDRLTEELEVLAGPLVENGLTVERHVLRGRAANVVTDFAAEAECDLIVTGSRGRGQLGSMLLGSVAAEIADHAPCPVLVARGSGVSRLLVATDGSRNANQVPDLLEAWGAFRDISADAVAVSIPDSPAFELMVGLYTLGDERLANKRRELRGQYQADAEAMARRLTEIGTPATPHLRAGDPAHEILLAADQLRSDLIVTGSRGLGGLERLLLGSVARKVLIHARCSVLILRTAAAPDPT